jgi:hypothetical protein
MAVPPRRSNHSVVAEPVAPACKWADYKENGAAAAPAAPLWHTELQTAGLAAEPANLAQTRVYVRVRPLQLRGTAGDSQRALCIETSGADGLQTLVLQDGPGGTESRYSFDRAFESESHEELADTIGAPLVASVLNGYNGAELRSRSQRTSHAVPIRVRRGDDERMTPG